MDFKTEHAIDVLKSWHLVEFFQPYNVPSKDDTKNKQVRISRNELFDSKNKLLPWINPEQKDRLGCDPGKKVTYTLYLKLFDKSLLTDLSDRIFGASDDENIQHELEQRLESEGETCFAKLQLDEFGVPDFQQLSVSTLPWALGKLNGGELHKITQENFEQRCGLLAEQLDRIKQALPSHPSYPDKQVLSAEVIFQLLTSLEQWAEFSTESAELNMGGKQDFSPFAFAIECYESNYPPKDKQLEDKSTPSSDEAAEEESDHLMPILNSFYISDIEKAIRSLKTGDSGKGLLSYLNDATAKNVDLYTDDALGFIESKLQPAITPEGRWPSNPEHNMTLMQQFAINTAFDELQPGGIISVNGPPGTGKTTLLRDVIAQNVVARAKVLASFSTVSDGIDDEGFLVPELTGYEMVVASSNNAAVENISKELPQKDSLDETFYDLDYLKSVANQLNAAERKAKLQPIKNPKEQCWGSISAIMGAKKKRERFNQRFFFKSNYKKKERIPDNREASTDFLTLWEWRRQYTGPSFIVAQKDFLGKLSQFNLLNQELQSIYQAQRFLDENSLGSVTAKNDEAIAVLIALVANLSDQFEDIESTLRITQNRRDKEQDQKAILESESPGFFSRLFFRKKSTAHTQQLNACRRELIRLRNSLGDLEERKHQTKTDLRKSRENLELNEQSKAALTAKYHAQQDELAAAKERFDKMYFGSRGKPITDAGLQRDALWQNKQINKVRSEVFIAALNLHQAWLFEAMNLSSFRKVICDHLADTIVGKTDSPGLALKAWQILFMFVPVVSTTFASLGRMFAKLPAESIGWLMIDEAGQAVPQAAVGGIWRAQRTIVVGDPLQIEPVFTSPPKLVEHLMTTKLGDEAASWMPTVWSVQKIADRANAYGCALPVMDKEEWIGIPLWVHRRCIEPMFSLANHIAYAGRMIHGFETAPAKEHPILGNNCWFNSAGHCTVKQYKAELGKDVGKLLKQIVEAGGPLEDVYIISPFKAVKNELKIELQSQYDQWKPGVSITAKAFKSWLGSHVGTVHTFQGKENHTVILVLGCDQQKPGGASWAAAKPNLLNVALTRAKKNIFVVGDSDVWSGQSYFSEVYSKLADGR